MRLAGISAALLLGISLQAQQTPAGEISGDYIEGRLNHVFGCYCEWSAEAAMGGTEAILAWDFKAGEVRGVPLAGVKVAAVMVGERTLSMGAEPRKSILFVHRGASPEQQKAAESLLREQYAALLGQITGVYAAPIQFERHAGRATLRIGDQLNLVMREAILPDDALQGARLWYDPFIPLTESTLATTVNNKYRGKDFNQQWEHSDIGTSGYYGSFRLVRQ